jgi:hypothetical protein
VLGVQEVPGSNPGSPTKTCHRLTHARGCPKPPLAFASYVFGDVVLSGEGVFDFPYCGTSLIVLRGSVFSVDD